MPLGPFGDYANKYRKSGWRGTLPLPPGQKEEPPVGFTGHGKPYPSDKDIRVWIKSTLSSNQHDDYVGGLGNICLRLAEVDTAFIEGLPVIYAGNNVDGWELIGIDVDAYGDKDGWNQLKELEERLGPLPATVMSSARWGETDESGIRIFLVPKGYRYSGKAAKHIDIIYRGHRYVVCGPSLHPSGTAYAWRYGLPGSTMSDYPEGVPALADVEVLPLAWFQFLSKGTGDGADERSDLDFGALTEWATTTFNHSDETCAFMQREVDKYVTELDSSDSHTPLTNVTHRLIRNGLEGHCGWAKAVTDYVDAWIESAKGKRDIDTMVGEVNRTVNGELAKCKADWDKHKYMPDDGCDMSADTDGWAKRLDDVELIEDGDFGGLGNVVGPLELEAPKPCNEYGMHDDGNAQHFIDLYGGNVKFVDGRDSWVVWSNDRWHRDLDGRYVNLAYRRVRLNQERFARRLADEVTAGDDTKKSAAKAWATWAKRSGNVGPIRDAITSAIRLYVAGSESVAVHANIFDSRPDLLGCANGILELTADPELRPPAKEDYVTFNTGTDYVPWRQLANADGEMFEGYELWLDYLNTFLPDQELQDYVQKVMGHLIIGENPEKRVVFLFGPHDTGKSTMIGALSGALGDYYGTVDIALFKPKDLNPGLIRAVPLRVTAMSEVDAGVMDASTVKRLTGNDKIMAEAKYSNDIFEGRPQFTTVIACNNPPNIKHADEALNERLLVLPFMKTVERASRKYERQTQIERHSGVAVLSWLVEGWKTYCEEGLSNPPDVVRKLKREMISGLNATQTFIEDVLERAVDCEEGRRAINRAQAKAEERGKQKYGAAELEMDWTPVHSRVYEMYVRWCNANGVDAASNPDLVKDLGLGKPQVKKVDGKAQRVYLGVRIKENEENHSGWRKK